MKGASIDDIELLLNEEARISGVFRWDALSRECCLANEEEVPWIFTWLAARHAKKRIFQMGSSPDPDWVADAVQNVARKIHWRWFFRNDDTAKPSVVVKCKETPAAPESFGKEFLPPELKA